MLAKKIIPRKVTKSKIKLWKSGKEGFVKEIATLFESVRGTKVVYNSPLLERGYHARCDACLIQEQGYSCNRLTDYPGPYEFEGGCMDCKHMCGKTPIHIGVRNYCGDHAYMMSKKLEAN